MKLISYNLELWLEDWLNGPVNYPAWNIGYSYTHRRNFLDYVNNSPDRLSVLDQSDHWLSKGMELFTSRRLPRSLFSRWIHQANHHSDPITKIPFKSSGADACRNSLVGLRTELNSGCRFAVLDRIPCPCGSNTQQERLRVSTGWLAST